MQKISGPIPFFQFKHLQDHDFCRHAVFSKHGGVSDPPYSSLNVRFTIGDEDECVWENRQRISSVFSTDVEHIISANQTHGVNCAVIQSPEDLSGFSKTAEGEIDDCDAIISSVPGLFVMTQVADCQPIVLCDPVREVVGVVHSGWRGTVQNVVGTTVRAMKKHFGCEGKNILAGIGPSLGPCCAEFVNRDKEFPENLHRFFLDEMKVDLWAITKAQLAAEGVNENAIECADICTCCTSDEFFSYRARQTTGRFGVVIGIPPRS